MDWYLPLILIVSIGGAGLLALFEQIKGFLKKLRVCPEAVIHIFANLLAIGIVVVVALTGSISGWNPNVTPDGLIQYGLLETILVMLFAILVWMSVIFSIDYMKGKNGLGYYYALIFTLFSGLATVIMASNFFTLFIAWELFAISGYALVAFERAKRGAVEAAFKYFLMSTIGSMFILLAIALTLGVYGTVSFADLYTTAVVPNDITALIVGLFIIGFGFTAALLFLGAWLPDAHSQAPSTISALLSGIVVKAGAFAIYRTIYWAFGGGTVDIADTSLIVSFLGIVTMIEGNFLVLGQFRRKDTIDFKRILAYSTIVHIGYIILGIGAGTELGLGSAFLHFITHALGKGSLFLLSGVLIATAGSRDIRDMKGLGRRSPFIGTILTVGLLSLGGIPITGGFISKLFIIVSVYNGAHILAWNIIIAILAVINSLLALGGYLYVLKYILFDASETKSEDKVKIPFFEGLTLGFMAVLLIVIGIYPKLLLELIIKAIQELPIF